MTRVNVVRPSTLCNKHLMAEYREMPRLVKNLETSLNRKNTPFNLDEIPNAYKLGTGHVKFFFDKFKFLHNRHIELRKELLERGYNLTDTDSDIFTKVPMEYYNDYQPTEHAIMLKEERIQLCI